MEVKRAMHLKPKESNQKAFLGQFVSLLLNYSKLYFPNFVIYHRYCIKYVVLKSFLFFINVNGIFIKTSLSLRKFWWDLFYRTYNFTITKAPVLFANLYQSKDCNLCFVNDWKETIRRGDGGEDKRDRGSEEAEEEK